MAFSLPEGGRVGGLGSYPVPTRILKDLLPHTPDAPVKVGVVDTGLVLTDGEPHPWLAGHVVFDPDTDADNIAADDPQRTRGHGTFVTGLILDEAPRAVVHVKGVLDKDTGNAEDDAVARAIHELAQQGVRIVNLSFSGDGWEADTPPAIAEAIAALGDGAVVVAAAGNSATQRPFYPAAMPSTDNGPAIIAVGALADDPNKARIAEFSNYGSWVRLYASGEHLTGPYANGWALWSGTSFAAAVVTGKIANQLGTHPALGAKDALDRLTAGENKVDVYGMNGMVQVPYLRAKEPSL